MYGEINLTVEGKDIQYQLNVGIDLEKANDHYYMPSLSFWKDKGSGGERELDTWDSDEYLLQTLLAKVLIPWTERKEILKAKDFADLLIMGVHIEDFVLIKELLEKGVEMGFFKYTL